MAETPFRKISLEDEISATEKKDDLPLGKSWQPQKARFQMAGILAIGLLLLFGLTVACGGMVVTTLIITSMTSNQDVDSVQLKLMIEELINFVTMLLPYIATPLGVALGYFFKERHSE